MSLNSKFIPLIVNLQPDRSGIESIWISVECGIGYPQHQVFAKFGTRSLQINRVGSPRNPDHDIGVQIDSYNGGQRSVTAQAATSAGSFYRHLPIRVGLLGQGGFRFDASCGLAPLLQYPFGPSGRLRSGKSTRPSGTTPDQERPQDV